MFETVKKDYAVHGRSLTDLAFWAMVTYRFGRWSQRRRTAVGRAATSAVYGAMKLWTQMVTGIELERETRVGDGFHIIHFGRIAIHPDAVFGDRVGVMHNVTIGTNMGDAAPVIGNDVFIGAGASVLGGITVGDGARIAANSLVIADVPAGGIAMGVPAKVIPGFAGLAASPAKQKVEVGS